MAGHRVDRGRCSRSSWSVWLVIAGDIDIKDWNMLEGNRVQLRAGRIVSEGRNVVEVNYTSEKTWSKILLFESLIVISLNSDLPSSRSNQ